MTVLDGRGDYIDSLPVGTMPEFSSQPLHLHVSTTQATLLHRAYTRHSFGLQGWAAQVTGLHIVQEDDEVRAWLSGRLYKKALPLACTPDGHILDCVDSSDLSGVTVTVVWTPDFTEVVLVRPAERISYRPATWVDFERFAVRVLTYPCNPEAAYDRSPLGDDDGDGWPNQAEVDSLVNPQCVDTDGDGLSDLFEGSFREYEAFLADTDSDLVDDYTEHLRGTNPAAWDTDGDGVSDYSEHLVGTDPLDPTE